MRNALCPITLRPLIPHRSHSTGLFFVLCHCPQCTAAQLSSSVLPNCPTLHCLSIQPVRSSWTSACSFQQKLLLYQYWLGDTGIILENERRHWKCLFSRLICSLIHLSSSTSSVLTCPPPKDPLHASSPAQPAPRRRLLLPLFFQSSSSLRDPSSSLTLIVLSLFTKAFHHQGRRCFSQAPAFFSNPRRLFIFCAGWRSAL